LIPLLRRQWTEWTIAISFMREDRAQTAMIMVGIAVGVAVIVFVTALIEGLQSNIIERTLGTQSHIRLLSPDEVNVLLPVAPGTLQLVQEDKRAQRLRSINNWQQVSATLDRIPTLTAVSPVVSGPAFARRGEALQSVALVGIDVERYQQIIPLRDYILAGQLRVGAGDAMIGKLLADDLGLRVGDKLRLETGQQNNTVVNIAAIFELGVRELDARYVYLDLKQAQSLLNLPGGVTVIDLTVADIFTADSIAEQIARLTSLKAESWMETNAQLMSALTAQTMSTNMIKIFVAISVAFGIASVLSVSVVQRTREIGILRATGATRQQILRVFLIQGGVLGLLGSVMGIAVSYTLVWVFNSFGPGLFYIPITNMLVVISLLLATLTGVLAAAVPSRRAARLDPATAIRYV
jgi:lipoprotein-releasing system permease protein